MILAIVLAVAACVVLFPAVLSRAVEAMVRLPDGPAKATIGYQSAIADLANVRRRLIDTKLLDEPCRKAVDTLTLGLVAGSDQP